MSPPRLAYRPAARLAGVPGFLGAPDLDTLGNTRLTARLLAGQLPVVVFPVRLVHTTRATLAVHDAPPTRSVTLCARPLAGGATVTALATAV